MNRAQRRSQKSRKSNAHRAGLTYLTVAGVVGGSFGLVSPAHGAALNLTANSCETINSQLSLLANNTDGGTLDISYVGECVLDSGYFMQGNSTINGPELGDLTLQVPVGLNYGIASNSELNLSDLSFVAPQGMGLTLSILELGNSAATSITNVNFRDSYLNGAAIYAEGSVTIANSSFTNIQSMGDGAAISAPAGSTIGISNSVFANNQASDEENGGAISAWGALTVDNSTFRANGADEDGGAIYSSGYPLVVTNSSFDSNGADRRGGAIYALYEARISNSTFTGNNAATAAASIFLGEGGVISNNTFWNNGAADIFSIGVDPVSAYFFGNILANDNPDTVKLLDPSQSIIDLGANLYTDSSFDDATTGDGSSALTTVEELKLTGLDSNQEPTVNSENTRYVAIAADSIAYDYYQADSAGINPTAGGAMLSLLAESDQRGASRPLSFGYDVGSYESGNKPVVSPTENPEAELADTGLPTGAGYLGLVAIGSAAIIGGSAGILRRRKKA